MTGDSSISDNRTASPVAMDKEMYGVVNRSSPPHRRSHPGSRIMKYSPGPAHPGHYGPHYRYRSRQHRHYQEENQWSCGSWIEYTLVVVLASVLLLGALALTLFWILQYHGGFAWRENPDKQFNLHPVLMVAGFITFSGFYTLL
ncbi:unnamed protein product [Acanthoscelides obtectus]|uniref:Cytochrome b561 domain-containing protein n=1 Tax=Acanthoscelides obtectus TaxID=200917 RepID=A0A9P0KIX1_ACAOB|nr:unnamed protein product [Acanthoscelides obtectus]CAK1646978.1 Putative cytochrome b561 [Acanthoscelides obtectus]